MLIWYLLLLIMTLLEHHRATGNKAESGGLQHRYWDSDGLIINDLVPEWLNATFELIMFE